jgi:D-2-hydroxyacid dehydrogenase (NADP+)
MTATGAKPKALIFAREADFLVARLSEAVPGIAFVGAADAAGLMPHAAEGDILIARDLDDIGGLLAAMPKLKWIQALTTGTSGIAAQPHLRADVMLTAARGFHSPQMSELAFLLMMALARRFKKILTNAQNAKWERWPQSLLAGKTAVIVGIGATSEELARRCKAFDMHVIGVSGSRTTVAHFNEIVPRAQLAQAASRADFLIVLAPSMAETHHLIGETVFTAMKPSAFLVNIARGELVDTQALLRALEARQIAGAGLDVFEQTPLPPDSPLWHRDDVIVTPHIGGMSDVYAQQALPILIDNLQAYAAGEIDRLRFRVSRP